MTQPIYKVYMGKWTEKMLNLPPDEQQTISAKMSAFRKEVGCEVVVFCSIPGGEPWTFWGVEKYPDVEAVHKYDMLMYQIRWALYIESVSYLGIAMKME